jgi:hypothetical protein
LRVRDVDARRRPAVLREREHVRPAAAADVEKATRPSTEEAQDDVTCRDAELRGRIDVVVPLRNAVVAFLAHPAMLAPLCVQDFRWYSRAIAPSGRGAAQENRIEGEL